MWRGCACAVTTLAAVSRTAMMKVCSFMVQRPSMAWASFRSSGQDERQSGRSGLVNRLDKKRSKKLAIPIFDSLRLDSLILTDVSNLTSKHDDTRPPDPRRNRLQGIPDRQTKPK